MLRAQQCGLPYELYSVAAALSFRHGSPMRFLRIGMIWQHCFLTATTEVAETGFVCPDSRHAETTVSVLWGDVRDPAKCKPRWPASDRVVKHAL